VKISNIEQGITNAEGRKERRAGFQPATVVGGILPLYPALSRRKRFTSPTFNHTLWQSSVPSKLDKCDSANRFVAYEKTHHDILYCSGVRDWLGCGTREHQRFKDHRFERSLEPENNQSQCVPQMGCHARLQSRGLPSSSLRWKKILPQIRLRQICLP